MSLLILRCRFSSHDPVHHGSVKPGAIVRDPYLQPALLLAEHNLQQVLLLRIAEAVEDRIFHKRLKQEFVDLPVLDLRTHMDVTVELVLHPVLLQVDITLQPFHFIPHRNFPVIVGYGVAQDERKGIDGVADVILFPVDRHPVDGVQSIIQEMRIDLGLQCLQLRFLSIFRSFLLLLPGDTQLPKSVIEFICNRLYLYRKGFLDGDLNGQISGSCFLHRVRHRVHGGDQFVSLPSQQIDGDSKEHQPDGSDDQQAPAYFLPEAQTVDGVDDHPFQFAVRECVYIVLRRGLDPSLLQERLCRAGQCLFILHAGAA